MSEEIKKNKFLGVELFRKMAGFNLIELLVVVTIILVLTGIGAYSIGKFNQMRETSEMKVYLSDRLKLAKNLAITNQLPDKTIDLKYVKVTILNNLLTVTAVKNDGTETTSPPYFSETIDSKKSVSVKVTDNNIPINSFGFLAKEGKLTDVNGNLSNGPLVVKISDRFGDYQITISSLGLIQ